MMRSCAIALMLAALLLFGCAGGKPQPEAGAPSLAKEPSVSDKCRSLCLEALEGGEDLSVGPGLGIAEADWVCDVAHSPRAPADDLPENQCADFREGRAHHFVEVTPDCDFLRES